VRFFFRQDDGAAAFSKRLLISRQNDLADVLYPQVEGADFLAILALAARRTRSLV
jgi:hypothetical protein